MNTTTQPTPLSTVKSFLAAISTKDTNTMKSLIHPNATACLIRSGEVKHLQFWDVVQALVDSGSSFEEISWDEIVHVDGDYATIWAPFKTSQDGRVKHEGSSTYVLWRDGEGRWVITAVADVARGVGDGTVFGREV